MLLIRIPWSTSKCSTASTAESENYREPVIANHECRWTSRFGDMVIVNYSALWRKILWWWTKLKPTPEILMSNLGCGFPNHYSLYNSYSITSANPSSSTDFIPHTGNQNPSATERGYRAESNYFCLRMAIISCFRFVFNCKVFLQHLLVAPDVTKSTCTVDGQPSCITSYRY